MKSKASFLMLLSLVFMTLVACSHENRDGNKRGPDSSATEILEKSSAGFSAAISRSEQAPLPSINIGLVTWVKVDSFTMNLNWGRDENLFHIAIKSTAGVWDTLDVALLTNPGLMSDSTLLLFTLSNQGEYGIYEYTPSNRLMKPAEVVWGWGPGELNEWGYPKISPNGRFIVFLGTYPPYSDDHSDDENEIIDTHGINFEVIELPSGRSIGRSKNYDQTSWSRHPDPRLYWTDRFVRWDYPVRDSLLLPAVP